MFAEAYTWFFHNGLVAVLVKGVLCPGIPVQYLRACLQFPIQLLPTDGYKFVGIGTGSEVVFYSLFLIGVCRKVSTAAVFFILA